MPHPTAAIHASPVAAEFQAPSPNAVRILCVDDEQAILDLLRLILEHAGYHVETVLSGAVAIERLLQPDTFDAVVLDLMMPDTDGATCVDQARTGGYEGLMVLCTAVQSAAVRDDLERRKNVVFVDKAAELHTLPEVLRRGGLKP